MSTELSGCLKELRDLKEAFEVDGTLEEVEYKALVEEVKARMRALRQFAGTAIVASKDDATIPSVISHGEANTHGEAVDKSGACIALPSMPQRSLSRARPRARAFWGSTLMCALNALGVLRDAASVLRS